MIQSLLLFLTPLCDNFDMCEASDMCNVSHPDGNRVDQDFTVNRNPSPNAHRLRKMSG